MVPKLSVLAATHNRREFMPWLAYVYNQLRWNGERQLVVADSSPGTRAEDHPIRGLVPDSELVILETDDPSISGKYRQLLDSAPGEIVHWLDDDDFHGPEILNDVYGIMDEGYDAVIPQTPSMGYYNLKTGGFRYHRYNMWTWGLYRTEKVRPFEFGAKSYGTENLWVRSLKTNLKTDTPTIGRRRGGERSHGFCISHNRNIANTMMKACWYQKDLVPIIGMDKVQTEELRHQLEALRKRVFG